MVMGPRLVALAVVALAAAALVAGCASYSSRTSARPIAFGSTEMTTAVDGVVVKRGRRYTVLPVPELTIRRGMGPSWDLGVTVHALGVRGGVRRTLAKTERFAVAVAPELGVAFALATNDGTDVLRGTATAPLIAEIRIARSTSIILGLKPNITVAAPATVVRGRTSATRVLLEPGASIGVRVRLSERFTLWPELSVHVPYALGDGREAPVAQGGVGLVF